MLGKILWNKKKSLGKLMFRNEKLNSKKKILAFQTPQLQNE
jgi:hypothetical protein